MRIVIGLLAVTAAACSGDDGGMFPVGGGGNDGGFIFPDTGGGGGGDAATGDAGMDAFVSPVDANEFDGRVCLLTDVRDFETCATTGAGGLTVRLGTATTTTSDDGSFTIVGQSGSGLVWRITGANIVSSFEPLADYFIPAISKADFDAMRTGADPDVTLVPGEGSMMIFVSRNGMGVATQTASTAPEAFYKPFYDGATEFAWQQTATGTFGVVWVPGLDVGSATIELGTGETVTGPIFDGGITFANIILP